MVLNPLTFWIAAGAVTLAAAYAYLRWVWFFRDPVRVPPADPAAVLAPADGKVIYVRPIEEGAVWSFKLGRPIPLPEITHSADPPRSGWVVGIYMSPLDVHYVYAPAFGRVDEVSHHTAARNWPMVDMWEYIRLTWLHRAVDLLGKRHHLENERLTLRLWMEGTNRPAERADARGAEGDLWLVEIADRFVNKIRCFVQSGQVVRAGQKLSFISRGSQVDVIMPDPQVHVVVRPGMQVYGALSVIARREGRP
ncbi:MAG: phosphatidylserine decarboxylase [Bacillota bacterium]|nr:phosphatidylserine decarboxylase [Bacillota bacterium]